MAFKTIQALINQELKQTELFIKQAMHSDVPLVRDVNEHIMQGGKRVRPMMVLLLSGLFGKQDQAANIKLAAIIEFIHTATLLHDDVVDESTMRRGQKTANHIWGNEASVLVGDFLYSRAFQSLVSIGKLPLMQILSAASNVMAEGEVLQLMHRHNPEISEDIYQKIIGAKTAQLFEAACTMAASLCNANEEQAQACGVFGKHLGLAFQLVDDALDYQGDNETLGKNLGDDLAEGKVTMPLIHLLQHCDEPQTKTISKAIVTGECGSLDDITALLKQYQSIDFTLSIAQKHIKLATHALSTLPQGAYNQALQDLTIFITQRNH
jgi:octaprenyl-diphosphate synthase